jgi:hypothetical protein
VQVDGLLRIGEHVTLWIEHEVDRLEEQSVVAEGRECARSKRVFGWARIAVPSSPGMRATSSRGISYVTRMVKT